MNPKKKHKIVTLGKYVALAAVLGKFLSIPANILIAKFLGPKSFGVLAIVDTLMIYFSYTNLGILMNLERQIPIEKSSLSIMRIVPYPPRKQKIALILGSSNICCKSFALSSSVPANGPCSLYVDVPRIGIKP